MFNGSGEWSGGPSAPRGIPSPRMKHENVKHALIVCVIAVVLATLLAFVTMAFVVAVSALASEPFGITKFENTIVANAEGEPATQAGSHPYAMTTRVVFANHHPTEEEEEEFIFEGVPNGDPKNVEVNLPAGLIVNPLASETKCTEEELEDAGICPNASVVGVAVLHAGLLGLETHDPIAEPRPVTARWREGKPEGKPQGGTEGGREKAARLDRGSALSLERGSRSKRGIVFGNRWSALRNGDFPGVAGPGPGWDCPTRSRHDVAQAKSPRQPRGKSGRASKGQ